MKKVCLKFGLSLGLLFFSLFFYGTKNVNAFEEVDIIRYYQFENNRDDYTETQDLDQNTGGGNISYSGGKYGDYSIYLDGDIEVYKNLTKLYGNASEFTISYWYKRDNALAGGGALEMPIQSTFNDGKPLFQYYFSSDGKYHFDFYNSNAQYVNWVSNDAVFTEDVWQNITVVGQYGSLSTTFKLYIDGEQKAGSFISGNPDINPNNGSDTSSNWTLRVGETQYDYNINGYIDDLAFFDIVLGTEDIGLIQDSSVYDIFSGPPPCESYTYTEWGQCDGYNQVRNWETKTPSDCEGGVAPDLSQPCSLDGNLRAIYPDQTSYILYTGATNKVSYGYYTNRVSIGDYVNVYRLSGTSTETFISSSTIIDLDYPDKQMGFSFFTLTGTSSDYVSNQYTYYKVVPVLSGSDWQSEIFPIYWSNDQNYFVSTLNTGLDTSRGTDTPFLFGEDIKQYVCSAEEWADTSWWTRLRCGGVYNALSIFGKVTNGIKNFIPNQVQRIKNIFPFSIPLKIYESWTDSADTGYPSDLAFLDVADVNGNIGFAVPEEWVGTSTTILPMWGPQVFTDNSDLYDFFAFIRSFSTYSLWIAFFFGLWSLGHDIIFNEFGYHETMSARRKDDYQLGAVDDYYRR